jgi:hypothetical protein
MLVKIRLPLELIMSFNLKCIFSEITLVLTHFVVLMTFVRQKTNTFSMNYSLIGGEGDGSGAAEFGTKQFGFMSKMK